MSRLKELLPIEAVNVNITAPDWRCAISEAGALLNATGTADPAYTDAMIATVDAHGPYIVIAPGFAFAHARPDSSVHHTGMSAIRLAHPVEFGNSDNDPVTLVVALAATDSDAHQQALAELAGLLSDPTRRAAIETATTATELHAALTADPTSQPAAPTPPAPTATKTETPTTHENTIPSKGFILTVCGNGLGTSLFLKNTLEGVLTTWGWDKYIRVEATDTISARGRAKEADVLLTSGAIAAALGEVGVPVVVIDDFTSAPQIDAALRHVYAV